MCGICGILQLDGRGVDLGLLREMNGLLAHRGPDDAGHFIDDPAGLAMRRLSIIDLAGGHQPLANEDETVHVVQNGEIYNYRELRASLADRGHRFRTESDTEVLVHLYEERGVGFVEELRGMFAIALWDARRRRLVLARDRFGIKPLYYRESSHQLSFASELKSLMVVPGFSKEIDGQALSAYLAFGWIPAPLTIFTEARKLPPGHVLTFQDGKRSLTRYARPAPVQRRDLRREGFDQLAGETLDRLRESVRAHLVADVPVGVLLSGGVDSSLITALAAQETSRLKTFSIGFEESSHNELDKARLVARRYGTDHHELVVRPSAARLLPKLIETFDEPFADSSALPTYLVSELASRHVKVALAGEGGDELFGGYFTYAADRLAPLLGVPSALARPFIERLPASPRTQRFKDRALRFAAGARLPRLERHCLWMTYFTDAAREEVLAAGSPRDADPRRWHRERYAETAGSEGLARAQDLDVGLYLPDDLLVKTDRASMAHSLEARVPFLDTAVSEFAFGVPARHKVLGFSKKRLLRAAAAPLLPPEVLEARKQGFSIPAASWFRGELQPMAREVLSDSSLRAQGVFDPGTVTRLLEDHVASRADNSRQLWTLLVFTMWHAEVVGRPSPTVSRAGVDCRPAGSPR